MKQRRQHRHPLKKWWQEQVPYQVKQVLCWLALAVVLVALFTHLAWVDVPIFFTAFTLFSIGMNVSKDYQENNATYHARWVVSAFLNGGAALIISIIWLYANGY